MKRIIVACANGVATSQAVASKVNRLLKERKVDAVVDAVNINCVAYITITKTVKEYPVPVINGIAFLTGVRQEDELKKLIDAVNKS